MIEHINSNIKENNTSDFNEWLQAMKMVAYLPDGTPAPFRRKLWLALSEQYLSMKNIDWETEQVKYFCNTSQGDDENLGDQIIKDLHRTGSTLCSGPTGSINQAKLKRILEGYARWNPEVGYCQGFNMLGALILQVMDKEEMESMKVMVYLIEGIFPSGYFNGSLNGLQVDMAVFRELMLARLPKLAKHLQRLQGPVDERFCEPPLTNVFTIQWFITMFSTSLPFNSVLRIWDLVLIEGSGILLRTALAIWSILEDKILCSKSADEFYCKMGQFSADMLKGTIIDSNGLIAKIVEFGPIPQLEQLRNKHLNNMKSWTTNRKHGCGALGLDEDGDSDDEAETPAGKTMDMRLIRRPSRVAINRKSFSENREKIALDIPLLKKQYNRIKEHQRQAHIILSAAARQSLTSISPNTNILIEGKNTNVMHHKSSTNRGGTLSRRSQYKVVTSSPTQHENNSFSISKKISPKHKKKLIYHKNEQLEEEIATPMKSSAILNVGPKCLKHNDSSSFSDSDNNSSTSTSLCDEDDSDHAFNFESSMESSPLHKINSNNYKFDNHKIYNDSVISQFKENRDIYDDISMTSLYCDNNPKLTINSDKNQSECVSNYSLEDKVLSVDADETINTCHNELISKMEKTDENLYSQQNISKSKTFTINKITDSINLVDLPITESILSTNFQFSVNESGVTNKYFERVNDIKTPTAINLDIFQLPKYDAVPLSSSTSGSDVTIEDKEKANSYAINKTLSLEKIKQPEIDKNQDSLILTYSHKSDSFSEQTSEQWQSELASRIIEENSRVLHRILNKDLTGDKNYSFNSVLNHKKYVYLDNLNSTVEILKNESVKPTIDINTFCKKETCDIDSFGDHENIETTNSSSENKLFENKNIKFDDDEIKHISTKTKDDIETESMKNLISDSVYIQYKDLKSPYNETLQFIAQNDDTDYITCLENVLSNEKEPAAMVIEEFSEQDNIQKQPLSPLLNNSSDISNLPVSFNELIFKLKLYSTDNTLRENSFDHTCDSYLLPTKTQESNQESEEINGTNYVSWMIENDIDKEKSSFNEIDEEAAATTKSDNLLLLEDLNNKYNSRVHLNLDSMTLSNDLSKYSKYDQSDFKYTVNKQESSLQKINELLTKRWDKEVFDKNIEHQFNTIEDKITLDNVASSPNRDLCDEVYNNTFSYKDYYIKNNTEKTNNDSLASNLSEKFIEQQKVMDLSSDRLCFTTDKTEKSLLENDNEHYSKTILANEEFPIRNNSMLEVDVHLNTLNTTNQNIDKNVITYSDYSKEDLVEISKTDSKIITNNCDKGDTIPILDNSTYSKYFKDENINDRLTSIKNTIKSIDNLCDDTKYNKLSKKDDDYIYDSKDLIRPIYMRKELQHLPMHSFEDDKFMAENKIRKDDSFTYLTATENKTANYTNFTIPKLEIRHTTVTSTLYDRILAQNEEKQYRRLEKQSFDKAFCKDNNLTTLIVSKPNSHSAENSPTKNKSETRNTKIDSKSCSNILLQLHNRT